MFTIDLEEKLIQEKEKGLQKHSSIISQASQILAESTEDDLKYLQECGFNIDEYKKIVNIHTREEGASALGSVRIFSTKEIKSICLKYNLKFLNIQHYTGNIPGDLPQKLRSVEKKLDVVKLDSARLSIVAPKSSFKLEDKPKDPLLFYDLGQGMYYLVHKWGDDLNIINRLKGFLKGYIFIDGTITIGIICSMLLTWNMIDPDQLIGYRIIATFAMGGLSYLAQCILMGIISWIFPNTDIWEYEDSWNKPYK